MDGSGIVCILIISEIHLIIHEENNMAKRNHDREGVFISDTKSC